MEVEKFKKNVVRQNSLITAKFNLRPLEYKVVLYSLHKMQLEKTNKVFIGVDEFKEEIIRNKKHKDPKGWMISALEGLTDKSVFINAKVEGGQDWAKFKWLSTYRMQYRDVGKRKNVFKGCVVSIHEDLMPYLLGLKKDFTIVYLSEAFSLDTFYAMRLFELMVRFNGITFKATVETFREYLGVEKGAYPEYKQLKQRVIDPALKSIKNLNGVEVEFDVQREKKKVSHVIFTPKISINLPKETEEMVDYEINKEVNDDKDISQDITNLDMMELPVQDMGVSESEGLMDILNSKKDSMVYEDLNVPDIIKMTEAAKVQFTRDFKYYDFSESEFSYIILSAWENITSKDNVKQISMRQYKYFVQEINNKIEMQAYEMSRF